MLTCKRLIVMTAAAWMVLVTTGCEQALFPANLPRSQYERFTYQREGITPEQEETILGNAPGGGKGSGEIDLRSRLRPLADR